MPRRPLTIVEFLTSVFYSVAFSVIGMFLAYHSSFFFIEITHRFPHLASWREVGWTDVGLVSIVCFGYLGLLIGLVFSAVRQWQWAMLSSLCSCLIVMISLNTILGLKDNNLFRIWNVNYVLLFALLIGLCYGSLYPALQWPTRKGVLLALSLWVMGMISGSWLFGYLFGQLAETNPFFEENAPTRVVELLYQVYYTNWGQIEGGVLGGALGGAIGLGISLCFRTTVAAQFKAGRNLPDDTDDSDKSV